MKKVLDVIICIFALAVAIYTARFLPVESFLRGSRAELTLAEAEAGYPEICVGEPAAADIPRIETAEDFEEAWTVSNVTIEPTGIITTGIGGRNAWVSEYQQRTSRRTRSRRRPAVQNILLDFFGEYSEYCLLELPDGAYVLAQLPLEDIKKIKTGKRITLPVGQKMSVSAQAQPELKEVCGTYGASVEEKFYCISDSWNESHEFMVFIIRVVIAIVVFFVWAVGLITLVYKLLGLKD